MPPLTVKEGNRLGLSGIASVSSPSHQPRCVAIANREIQKAKGSVRFLVSLPCTTDFALDRETVIFEPVSGPIRGAEVDPCRVLSNYYQLTHEARKRFLLTADEFMRANLNPTSVEKAKQERQPDA